MMLTAFLLLGTALGMFGQGVIKSPSLRGFQEAEFAKIKIQSDVRLKEVIGIDVHFDLKFRYSNAALNRAEANSGPYDYDLICELLNPNGVPISATHDAALWRDPAGHVHTNQTIRLVEDRNEFKNRHFFLPYYAPNLPEGPHNVRVRVAIRDIRTKKILAEYKTGVLEIHKPPVRLYRIRMKEVEVSETDFDKENWDYFFLTETEGLPDLKWEVQRAGDPVFSSRRRKNVTQFEGNFRDNSGVFTLSEGDRIQLAIIDNDMTSVSDTIGVSNLDPWKKDFQPGLIEVPPFSLVKKMNYRIEVYEKPKVTISDLKLEEAAKYSGVTGAKIAFNFEFKKEYEDQKFGVEFFQIVDSVYKKRFFPDRVIIIEGEGKLIRPGYIEFGKTDKGHMEFFIPHFYLLRDFRDQSLDFGVHGVSQYEELNFSNRLQTLNFTAPIPFLDDIRTFDHSVEVTKWKGANGLMLRFRYQVPKLYYTESRQADFLLRPDFRIGDIDVDNEVVEFLSPKEFEFEKGQIRIPKLERNGRMAFFIPFSKVGATGTHSFSVRLDGWMQTDEAAFLLGRDRLVEEISAPAAEEVTLYISQAKAKKLFWIGEAPQLRWKVYLGPYLQKRSSLASGAKKAFWGEEENVTFWGPSTDEVTIELIHSGTGEKDEVLGAWSGPLNKLIERKGRTYKAKPYGLKKLFIEIAPFE